MKLILCIIIFLLFRPLEECDDLDVPLFRLLTAALARELGVDVFGFDALVQSQTKNVFVVDVNFLPGYKGNLIRPVYSGRLFPSPFG